MNRVPPAILDGHIVSQGILGPLSWATVARTTPKKLRRVSPLVVGGAPGGYPIIEPLLQGPNGGSRG